NPLFLFLLLPTLLASRAVGCPGTKDNDVWWSGVAHNSFEETYRKPFGAVTTEERAVTLRLSTCKDDVQRVRLRVWDNATNRERWFEMHDEGSDTVARQWWKLDLP